MWPLHLNEFDTPEIRSRISDGTQGMFVCLYEGMMVNVMICVDALNLEVWSSLERLVEADGGGAVEDYVDAGGEPLHVLGADGQAWLRQLAADGDDLLVEVRVDLTHSVKKLPDRKYRKKSMRSKSYISIGK